MLESNIKSSTDIPNSPQCQFFVLRKKRLCRMTVKPGRQYCGEHEPEPKAEDGQNDTRIPCPNDPKHTCYVSKLEKHLAICNARPAEPPPYIVHNINAPLDSEPPMKVTLGDVPKEKMKELMDKINHLFDKYLKDNIETMVDPDIHLAVLEDFQAADRAESSRRHLRQVSGLLRAAEGARLVGDHTCYIELGAGKGHLSYYLWSAWCARAARSRVVLVDRASLRHKRDNKLLQYNHHDESAGGEGEAAAGEWVSRVRADLADVVLCRLPAVAAARTDRVVGLAKHLCGAATDYALRCLLSSSKTAGVVLATCCHHRCRWGHLLGAQWLQEAGIARAEFEVMVRMVSWATCGHGRPRTARAPTSSDSAPQSEDKPNPSIDAEDNGEHDSASEHVNNGDDKKNGNESADAIVAARAGMGRRARLLLDWARAEALRGHGFSAKLVTFVPDHVTPENIAILAVKH